MEGKRVTKEDYKYCNKLKREFWRFGEPNPKTKKIIIHSENVLHRCPVENLISGEIEYKVFSVECSCKEFYEKHKNDSTKVKK